MNMKWIERMGLGRIYDEIEKTRFDIEVPKGAEFIGAQHDATILVMLVRDRFGPRNPGRSNRNLEKRSVLRVKDGMMIAEEESRYIGSDNGWHLFEVKGE
jgi:hypothetical protein